MSSGGGVELRFFVGEPRSVNKGSYMRKTITNVFIVLTVCFCIILLSGCAFDLVHVKQTPIQLTSIQNLKKSWKLVDEVKVRLDTGYSRKLKGGTKWDYVGNIEYGDVYKTKDQIVTVEGSNIFEAYIVVSDDNIVGFYLPVENTYSPLSSPKKIHKN